MSTATSIHLRTPRRIAVVSILNGTTDVLRVTDEGVDLSLFLGSDTDAAETALLLIEALSELRTNALVRLAVREFGRGPGAPVDSAKYRRDMADAGRGAMVR